jgi:hypothetical protein
VRFKTEDLFMSIYKLLFAGLALMAISIAQNTVSPLACNLKAFTPEERADWRKRIDQVMGSVTSVADLTDGYTFRIDAKKTSYVEVAKWVELERRCCPFFDFDLKLRGEDGTVSLNLTGRDGVKQFIAADFEMLFKRFPAR